MAIEIKNLTHTYMPGTPFQSVAIESVNALIEEGEFVGLIGHTGSGKSTLIQHINGLMKPTGGTVLVDGADITLKETSLREIRKKVGLVFQYPEYQLFEETILKDVAFGPKNLGFDAKAATLMAREALASVGIGEDLFEKSPFELSGGQKRRVAIAGVLAMNPKYLIMDEPTAGLDPRGRDEVLSLLASIHARGGVTVIMVSHSMTDVSRLCNRILVMSHGRLIMDGAPADIFAREDELRSVGLDVPPLSSLARSLTAAGVPVPPGSFRIDQLKSAILGALSRKEDSANA